MAWIKFAFDDGFHVAWTVRSRHPQIYLHAIGDGPQGNRVTPDMAQMRFEKSRTHSCWLPILFPTRARRRMVQPWPPHTRAAKNL